MKRKKSECGDVQSGSLAIQEKPGAVEYHEVVCPECSYWEVISKDAHPVCSGKCNFTSIMLPNLRF